MRLNFDAERHDKWHTCSPWVTRRFPAGCEILNSSISRRKLAIWSYLFTLSSWTTVYKISFNNVPFYKPVFKVTSFHNVLHLKLCINYCFPLWSVHPPCLRMWPLILKSDPVSIYSVWRSIITLNTQSVRPCLRVYFFYPWTILLRRDTGHKCEQSALRNELLLE